MVKAEILEQIIFPAIDEFMVGGKTFARAPEAVIFGSGGALESITFVSFIISVETIVAEKTGKSIRLVDEKALSRRSSPFKTADSLAEYVEALLGEARG